MQPLRARRATSFIVCISRPRTARNKCLVKTRMLSRGILFSCFNLIFLLLECAHFLRDPVQGVAVRSNFGKQAIRIEISHGEMPPLFFISIRRFPELRAQALDLAEEIGIMSERS